MLVIPILFGTVLVMAICVVLLLFGVTRDTRQGIALILVEFVLETWSLSPLGIGLGVNLFATDLVFLSIAFAALARTAYHRHSDPIHWLWLAFGAVLFASFLIGLPTYKTTAGVEFRQYFYIWVGTLYLLVMPMAEKEWRFLLQAMGWAAALLVAIALYRWAVGAFGVGSQPWLESSENSRFRVLNANQAVFLAQVLVLGAVFHLKKSGLSLAGNWKLALLALCILVLQHRTVWLVTIMSFGVLALVDAEVRSKAGKYSLMLLFLIAVAVPIALFSKVSDTLYHAAVVEPFSRDSTLVWRVESWLTSVLEWMRAGPKEWLIGFPFGKGFYRYLEFKRTYVDAYPHSYYVTTLLRAGLLGIFTLLSAYYIAGLRLSKAATNPCGEHWGCRTVMLLLFGQLVFFVSYNPGFVQAIVIGLGLRMAMELGKKQPMEPAALNHRYSPSIPAYRHD